MKKIVTYLLLICTLALLLCGCDAVKNIPDGNYRVELSDYDEQGYKDFVEFEFGGGQLISMVADAVATDGSLKSENAELREAMQSVAGTYPEKYYKDLVNQYIEKCSAEEVDVVAGATMTSENFIVLMKAAEKAARSGGQSPVVVSVDD